jgi:hypothetical protein
MKFKPLSHANPIARRARATLAAALFLVGSGWFQPAAALLIFHDRAAWNAAIAGQITTETFGSDIAFGPSITFSTGIASTGAGPNPIASVLTDSNTVMNGAYFGRVGALSNNFSGISWSFPGAIFAFGGDWFGPATAARLTLTGNFDGAGDVTIDFFDQLGTSDGFLGIIGAGAFSSVTFGTHFQSDEAFAVDNLSFARVNAVSSPPAAYLLLGGLALLGLRRGRPSR